MGYLLKEALKTVCGVNRWSYAVFWKFACQNPKLLIWEECYYEPVLYSSNPELAFQNMSACWTSNDVCNSQNLQTRERIQLLINKMMIENQFNILGEGLVGRAAITGNHQWILSDGYCREAHPVEVLKELSNQFSAGMQTIAVIPVLPHGVVHLGSHKPIMENLGVVNDVKMLICQLGCVPGVLLSDENAMKEPVLKSEPILVSSNYVTNSIDPVICAGQTSSSVSQSFLEYPQAFVVPPMKPNISPKNNHRKEAIKAEVIPSNPNMWAVQQSSTYVPRPSSHQQSLVGPSTLNSFAMSQPRVDAGPSPICLEDIVLPSITHSVASSSGDVNNLTTNYAQIQLDGDMGTVENDLFQALGIMLTQDNENQSLSELIPDFGYDAKMLETNYEDPCVNQSGDDLFDILGSDFKNKLLSGSSNTKDMGHNNPSTSFISQDKSDSGIFSGTGFDHRQDFAASTPSAKQILDDNVSCYTTLTNMSSSSGPNASCSYGHAGVSNQILGELFGVPKSHAKSRIMTSSSFDSSKETHTTFPQSSSVYGSQVSSWVEQARDMKKTTSVSTASSKKPNEPSKPTRKRLKPGENPRPRPKDRQMIQDRVKELREIVPNGAKCSIDALLERTIKHMLFLQSVTKHADKLKQTGESKIMDKEGGLRLKDNFEGGATWAYEIGSESMVCPIIVEDLNEPRQMLVEMLCEQRGFFLEIADIIRGLGLTILKGFMETKNEKIWARFTVEANRDITRMEVFISLVHLLEQTSKNGAETSNGTDNEATKAHHFHQAASIPATSSLH